MDSNRANLDGLASWPPFNSRPEQTPEIVGRLPMPKLMIDDHAETDRFEYTVTTICPCHGQLRDRTPVKLLNWHPGQPIGIAVIDRIVVGFDDPRGTHQIGPRGHLRLPASIRHQCGIVRGQKLLVAVSTEHRIAIAYPTTAVDRALSSLHALAWSAVQ